MIKQATAARARRKRARENWAEKPGLKLLVFSLFFSALLHASFNPPAS